MNPIYIFMSVLHAWGLNKTHFSLSWVLNIFVALYVFILFGLTPNWIKWNIVQSLTQSTLLTFCQVYNIYLGMYL